MHRVQIHFQKINKALINPWILVMMLKGGEGRWALFFFSAEGGPPDKEEDLFCPPQRSVERALLLRWGDQPQSPTAGKAHVLCRRPHAQQPSHGMSSVLLQVVTAPIVNWSEQILSKLSLPNLMSQDVPNPPPDYYTCQFRTNKLERYKHSGPESRVTLILLLHSPCFLPAGFWAATTKTRSSRRPRDTRWWVKKTKRSRGTRGRAVHFTVVHVEMKTECLWCILG